MAASKKELVLNATQWMQVFKRDRPKGTGAIFLFFNQDDPEGSAVCVGSINKEGIRAACRGILKKLDGGNLVVNPYDT